MAIRLESQQCKIAPIMIQNYKNSFQNHLAAQPMTSYIQKRTEFALSIRKEQKSKIFQAYRRKYFKILPQNIELDDFIEHFDLKDDPKFSKENLENDEFVLVNILLAKRENLIKISFKKSLNGEMIDEKVLPPPESEFELEEVPLPKQYPFRLQSALYQAITDDIYTNSGKYRKLEKGVQRKIIDFWLDFLSRNKYIETAIQKEFHQVILSCLQWFVTEIESPDLRKRIFKWVSGTDGLRLLSNCLSGQFMRYNENSKLYDIILRGLKHKKVETKINAIDTLSKCTRNGDYDDIDMILKHFPILFSALLNFFYDNEILNSMYVNPDVMKSVRQAAHCVLNFLDSYQKNTLDCLKEGAGYVGAWLITQRDPDLLEEGLNIFNLIAGIQDSQLSRQSLRFLINNISINETRVWQTIGQSYQVVKHENKEIRKSFVWFILKFLANGGLQQIAALNSVFRYPKNESLVEMLIIMFVQNDNPIMREYILHCISAILYYGETVQQCYHSQENQLQKRTMETLTIKYVTQKILDSQMIRILRQLQTKHDTLDMKNNNFSRLVTCLLDFLNGKCEFEI